MLKLGQISTDSRAIESVHFYECLHVLKLSFHTCNKGFVMF